MRIMQNNVWENTRGFFPLQKGGGGEENDKNVSPMCDQRSVSKRRKYLQKKSGKREEGAFQFFSLFDMESECIYMALPM